MRNAPLIIALDFESLVETEAFLERLGKGGLFVKVGMELFYKEGPAAVHRLKELGHDVFLDLKLHDIPNTVGRAMKNLADLGCDLVNVHAAGGEMMMEAALEGLEAGTPPGKRRPFCIAVTQLTSTGEDRMKAEQLIQVSLEESVLHYTAIAHKAGLDGVVCSASEAGGIRQSFGRDFLTVTPGIRFEDDAIGDQRRIATPQFARTAGISAIVVGRPITRAEDPAFAYEKMLQSWKGMYV